MHHFYELKTCVKCGKIKIELIPTILDGDISSILIVIIYFSFFHLGRNQSLSEISLQKQQECRLA